MAQAVSLATIATANENIVLAALRLQPEGISRAEIAKRTRLSSQTVSNVCRRLIERGLVSEVGNRPVDGPGKPAAILQLKASGAYAVGVHLDPGLITCVLLDFRGDCVLSVKKSPPPFGEPEQTISMISEAIEELLGAMGLSIDDVHGIGVAAPGPIDAANGALVRPRLAPGWAGLRVPDLLEARFGTPVFLMKDVTAAVVAEHWVKPTEEASNQAFVYWGAGVGIGLMLEGRVHEGSTSNAGDVGHAIVDPGGALCDCGRRGCFGEISRPYRMVLEGLRSGAIPPPAGWDSNASEADISLDICTVEQLFQMLWSSAELGNPAAKAVVERAMRGAELYLSNLVALLDVDQIVCGGPSWEPMRKLLLPTLNEHLSVTEDVRVRDSVFGGEVAAIGAACLVFQSFFPR